MIVGFSEPPPAPEPLLDAPVNLVIEVVPIRSNLQKYQVAADPIIIFLFLYSHWIRGITLLQFQSRLHF